MTRVLAAVIQAQMLMMLFCCGSVSAAEITECWAFTTVFNENDVGFPIEHLTTIGFTANDPAGIIQSARAKRANDTDWIPLALNAHGSYEKLLIPAEGGQWQVQAIDGSGQSVSSCTTHNLNKLIEMPLVQNVVIYNDGSKTPTLCWDPVAAADYYKVRVMEQTFDLSYDAYLQQHIRCHQIPEGNLIPGEEVYLRIEARDADDGHLENRSVRLMPYTPSATATPTINWQFPTGGFVGGSPAIGPNGLIYFGSADSHVYAVRSNGTLAWSKTVGGVCNSPAIAIDGTVYVGSSDGNLYAFTAEGLLKWTYPLGNSADVIPAIGRDGTIYAERTTLNPSDGILFALTPEGELKWRTPLQNGPASTVSIGPNGTLYATSWDGHLYALDHKTGRKIWQFQTGAPIADAVAIGSDGTIYIGSYDYYVYAVSTDGRKKWAFHTDGIAGSSPVIGPDGTVYIGTQGLGVQPGYLYAITAQGTEKWRFAVGDAIGSTPSIAQNGTVYVGSMDGNFYAVNSDGKQKWAVATGEFITASPAISNASTIYMGSWDNMLYSINDASGGLADSAWPMYRHDLTHTGRQNSTRRSLPHLPILLLYSRQ